MYTSIEFARHLAQHNNEIKYFPILNRIACVQSQSLTNANDGQFEKAKNSLRVINENGYDLITFKRSQEYLKFNYSINTKSECETLCINHASSTQFPAGNNISRNDKNSFIRGVRHFIDFFKVYRPSCIIISDIESEGVFACIAATRLGIPILFDTSVLGLVELNSLKFNESKVISLANALDVMLFIAQYAKATFTYSRLIKDELVSNGIERKDIIYSESQSTSDSIPEDFIGSNMLIEIINSVTSHVNIPSAVTKEETVTDGFIDLVSPNISNTPLKKYFVQRPLEIMENDNDGINSNNYSEYVEVYADKYHKICSSVKGGEEYSLSINCLGKKVNSKGAVADILFYDSDGSLINEPYPSMASSTKFGAYFYLMVDSYGKESTRSYKFVTPKNAISVHIKIWAHDTNSPIKIMLDYELISTSEISKKLLKENKYFKSFTKILEEARKIPDSNGSEYFSKHNLRVGVIADVYMYNFYKDVFTDVHYLSPDNYTEKMSLGLDLIIYTTCWKGVHHEEWRGLKFREKPKKALESIIEQAKKENVKTIFQTIEDPSNFDYFLPIAERFDYVITTDTDCIDLYKNRLGHERVFFGEYGVNPQFNNPIGCRRDIRNASFFAGSYPRRYQERCDDMEIVFDSIIESDSELLIVDRNFGSDSDDLSFPLRFQPNVLPPVEHAILQKLHKLFRYNLNFNSIKQSPTMCAMRVYELQAQGAGIISNYAKSVFNKFPGIRLVPCKENMEFDFVDESWDEYRQNMANLREVLDDKTSYQVVSKLLNNVGLPSIPRKNTAIAVICERKTPQIIESFEKQGYSERILLEESELSDWNSIKDENNVGYFCWFSDENSYERYYLNDLVNGFKYTDCDYITKNCHFDSSGLFLRGAQHEYTNICSGLGLSLFSVKRFSPLDILNYDRTTSFELDNGYSIDPFEVNFIKFKECKSFENFIPELSVIVPVYNNSRFLLTKCIPSLRRNKLWDTMEVILVDDGSSDKDTLQVVKELAVSNHNIKAIFNDGNGSGSASRPRNQGIEAARGPLVTFLDPDNEISPGGYDILYELYHLASNEAERSIDFVSGYHLKVGDEIKIIGRHTSERMSVVNNLKASFFERGKFPVVGTQPAIISRNFLLSKDIRFIEGSAGQDTLFGWELLANADCAAFSDSAHIIYYADRSDSITNEVNVEYFQKKLILEIAQKKFLEENGLLELFIKYRFDSFMNDWYLKKFKYVSKNNKQQCLDILKSICELYGKDIEQYL